MITRLLSCRYVYSLSFLVNVVIRRRVLLSGVLFTSLTMLLLSLNQMNSMSKDPNRHHALYGQ